MTLVVLALASCLATATAHIHSHKVAHIDKDKVSLETWALALFSSVLVAAAGVFPLLLNRWIPLDKRDGGLTLRIVLAFAVGGLLGDVFLHLLPEAWGPVTGAARDWKINAWVLFGLISFLLVEKLCSSTESSDREAAGNEQCATQLQANGNTGHSVSPAVCSGDSKGDKSTVTCDESKGEKREVRGYLNLVANCTDNFTHGLAIAASYVAGDMVGMLTTVAILCHEIPHEVGDFAILLSSGFNKWSAAKAQLLTATWGVVGVIAGLTAEHLSSTSSWLLPFTAGGFLYIALVSIVPQLLKDTSLLHSVLEVAALILGIIVMAMVSMVEKHSCQHMPPHLAS